MNTSKPRGVSLIELMIALAIGTVLVLGLVQVFSASRAAYQMSEGMARVQENARFAMDFLQRDIRMAGHFGCVNDQAHFVQDEGEPMVRTNAVPSLDFNISIEGYEAEDTGPGDTAVIGELAAWASPPITLNPAPVTGSDIIVLRYFSPRGTPVTAVDASSATVTIPPIFPAGAPSPQPPDGWPVLTDDGVGAPTLFGIADCSQADVFPATGDAAGTLAVSDGNEAAATIAADLQARYNPHPAGQTRLYRANSIVYYVAQNPTTGEPALRRARADSTGAYSTNEELVEGVESLQLLYGRDETTNISSATPPVGNITSLDTADGIGGATEQWRRVGLVQVGMLVRSPDPAVATQAESDTANPRVLGVEFVPGSTNDTRYRGTYEATIAVRNRLFGN